MNITTAQAIRAIHNTRIEMAGKCRQRAKTSAEPLLDRNSGTTTVRTDSQPIQREQQWESSK